MVRKLAALATILFVIATACIPLLSVSAKSYDYVTDGLEALYVGNNNSGSGQNKNASVWKDLSGKGNDITNVPKDANNYFTDTGYHLDTMKVFFNDKIKDVMNGDEFTAEMNLGDITSKGTSWNTFLNCSNDSFSLFRLISSDQLVVKNQTDASKANKRPTAANGLDLFKNSTVTVTFKVGGKITVYVDGEQVAQEDAVYKLSCGDFFFGHDGPERCYATEFRSIRFYSKALTAQQVKANYEVDKAVLGVPYSESSSSSSSSSQPSSSSSSVSSASSSTAPGSSSTSSDSNPDTGDNSVYAYAVFGFTALASMMLVIRNKRIRTR